MRECPWCGRQNLNVYAYCQECGRGFDDPYPDEPEKNPAVPPQKGFLARLLGR